MQPTKKSSAATQQRLREIRMEAYQKARDEAAKRENFTWALWAGYVTGFVTAIGWAWFTIASGWRLGVMAAGVGAAIGFAMWIAGRGRSERFGYAAAHIAVGAMLFGNLLIILAGYLQHFSSYTEAIEAFDWRIVGQVALNFLRPWDLVFALIAVAAAYKLSFRTVEEERTMI